MIKQEHELGPDEDGPTSTSDLLVEQSLQAATASIEIFNKPKFLYRHEVFSVLIISAWELLLKAKIIRENGENVESVFVLDKKINGQKTFKRSTGGNPKTHNLVHLSGKILSMSDSDMEKSCRDNILALYSFRNNAVHFVSERQAATSSIARLGAASVINYALLVRKWFGIEFMAQDCDFLPLMFASGTDLTVVPLPADNEFARGLVEEWDRLAHEHAGQRSEQSFTIGMEVTIRRTRDADAPAVRWTNDPEAPGVNLKDEDISSRYPWSYKELTNRLRDRYSGFLMNDEYHRIRKGVEDDLKYCWTRRLEPKNPRSLFKRLYSQAILEVFDKHYTKK